MGLVVAVVAVAATACGDDDPAAITGLRAAPGFGVTEVVDRLAGPTQLTFHPDGRLLVAELNGGENDGAGRVVALAAEPDGDDEVLVEGLDKPTGVAVVGDKLWILEATALSSAPVAGGVASPVFGDLPNNGRSQTTLTVTPEGGLVYATSGSRRGPRVVDGSGILWSFTPGVDIEPVVLATGFKNAYAHVIDGEGRLWATEVSDGSFDGLPAADELVAVMAGADHGWPHCVGDRRPVAEFGGDPVGCEAGPPSHAVFAPGATPTSVVVAPWDDELLVIALWQERRVVTVPTSADGRPHQPVEILSGDLRPQHLLVDGDRLLVVDHEGGRILAVEPA